MIGIQNPFIADDRAPKVGVCIAAGDDVPVTDPAPLLYPLRVVLIVTVADCPATRELTATSPDPLMLTDPAVVDALQVKLGL